MKRVFRAHPLMILSVIKPFLFILVFPLIKGIFQYLTNHTLNGILSLEIFSFCIILAISILRCMSFRLTVTENTVQYKMGFIFIRSSKININSLSSVQTIQNPLDAIFRSVTYCINTEAGPKNKTDFKFKLSQRDSHNVSEILYGKRSSTAVKFSIYKVMALAATSSSVVSGMIIGVPIINRLGKLLNLALNDILLHEINSVSENVKTYFPPIVNAVTLLFIIFYAISFIYSFIKNMNFRLFLDSDKLEVRSGFFVRSRTAFKKESVNNVKIDQSPLMRFFKQYAMKVSVGGYGDSKSTSAVIVPIAMHGDIKHQFSVYFPFLEPNGATVKPEHTSLIKSRFYFMPALYFILLFLTSLITALIFKKFYRVILFLTFVIGCVILYYANLCLFEFKFSKIRMGDNIFVQGVKGFKTCELYCLKENIGQIVVMQSIPDRFQNTCSVKINVRSERADTIRIRLLNYDSVKELILNSYDINE